MKIKIINGPNLNLLGQRETNIYGNENFDNYFKKLKNKFPTIDLTYFQSNIEGELISEIQKSNSDNYNAIILNAAAYTHYSIGIRDAIKAIKIPVVETHISNIFSREKFRHKSVISGVCVAVISGFGLKSYDLAILSFIDK